jgi:4-hydroxy-L-threonine phosphate dehydrogenase PdxA
MKNKPILIVAAEPNSIFLEILFKSIIKFKYKSPLILICCKKILIKQMRQFKFTKKINLLNLSKIKNYKLDNRNINLINIEYKKVNNELNNQHTNNYINNSFNVALNLIRKNFSNKLINGPINKKTFLKKKYLGITEFISKKYRIKKTGMLIYNKKLSVCPVTTHLPLKLVAKNITKKLIEEKIQLIDHFYKSKLKYKPHIGVTGLNPHCESILKNNEDEQIVYKAIHSQKKRGVKVYGPFSADTIFLKKNRKKFNVILGMYHDQVLTPIKSIYEFDAINITIGLPFMRATPDHGPNKVMIGKNKSNPQSLISALNFLDQF